jgi:hypothetical protein
MQRIHLLDSLRLQSTVLTGYKYSTNSWFSFKVMSFGPRAWPPVPTPNFVIEWILIGPDHGYLSTYSCNSAFWWHTVLVTLAGAMLGQRLHMITAYWSNLLKLTKLRQLLGGYKSQSWKSIVMPFWGITEDNRDCFRNSFLLATREIVIAWVLVFPESPYRIQTRYVL